LFLTTFNFTIIILLFCSPGWVCNAICDDMEFFLNAQLELTHTRTAKLSKFVALQTKANTLFFLDAVHYMATLCWLPESFDVNINFLILIMNVWHMFGWFLSIKCDFLFVNRLHTGSFETLALWQWPHNIMFETILHYIYTKRPLNHLIIFAETFGTNWNYTLYIYITNIVKYTNTIWQPSPAFLLWILMSHRLYKYI